MKLRDWLQAEPFTLTMSSGFFSFFAHAGMLSVLVEEKMIPTRVSGSSAGGLVGSLWASGCTMPDLIERLLTLQKADFWDPGMGLGLLKGKLFRQLLRDISEVERLEACPRPVVLSLHDGLSRSTHVFDSGSFADVVYGTCAVPFMFQPVWINRRPYWDGGIKDRAGLAGIEDGSRVFYHHIVSRSAWRRKDDPALQIPDRANMATLVIEGLPRVGPNQLEQGKIAFEQARASTSQALEQPIIDNEVNVNAGRLV